MGFDYTTPPCDVLVLTHLFWLFNIQNRALAAPRQLHLRCSYYTTNCHTLYTSKRLLSIFWYSVLKVTNILYPVGIEHEPPNDDSWKLYQRAS